MSAATKKGMENRKRKEKTLPLTVLPSSTLEIPPFYWLPGNNNKICSGSPPIGMAFL